MALTQNTMTLNHFSHLTRVFHESFNKNPKTLC